PFWRRCSRTHPSSLQLFGFQCMETVDRMVNVNNSQRLGTVVLHELSYAVEEVNVTPSTSGQSNSSMIIDRDMIERYPSLSLNDLLNFLPNRKVAAPSVQSMQDRKSTRLNSSHVKISYAVFCL